MKRRFLALFVSVAGCSMLIPISATSVSARCWTVSGHSFCDNRESYGGRNTGDRERSGNSDNRENMQEEERRKVRQNEEAERKRKADEADRQGMEAANRGDWRDAANHFIEALGFAPDSAEIRTHLNRANTALADAGSASEILALHQRIQDAVAAANIESLRNKLEDVQAERQLKSMSENFRAGTKVRKPIEVRGDAGVKVLYPALRRPISSQSPPGRVLALSQPKIKEIDEEIRLAQVALRRLIKSNMQSEEERVEWTRVSEEATVEAEDLSVNLVIDLVGAHVDHLTKINGGERTEVLNKLLSRTPENGHGSGLHTAYGMLLNRRDELKRIHEEIRLAGKENDLRVKIAKFSLNRDTSFSKENLWDAVSQIKKVEDFAGPGKDLLDAVYTIYKQAASFEILSTTRTNQEKTLQAAAVLRRYIIRLEMKKKAAGAGLSG